MKSVANGGVQGIIPSEVHFGEVPPIMDPKEPTHKINGTDSKDQRKLR